MEGVSNGGMLYHEVQESKLCAVHCVNTVLQGPFFSEFDLAAVASDLDRTERQMMVQGSGDFVPEESHNVSLDGDFSIQWESTNFSITLFSLISQNFCNNLVNVAYETFRSEVLQLLCTFLPVNQSNVGCIGTPFKESIRMGFVKYPMMSCLSTSQHLMKSPIVK
ncbi:hypothetical protein MTR67_045296 [Solanum verrucosum]|uniref:ubiquitinyl hydrolase 1 n=1 Tax=Solanum verrucosum TaxID=315347 RepID=A0AAF0UVM7_SOLVR|nr:hypothetical protein MTR67_045296 [Solanum verrucosum]